jgi:hypothetical protein
MTVTGATPAAAAVPVPPAANGVYQIARTTSSVMDVQGGSNAPGTPVLVWSPNGQENQQFELRRVPDTSYYFIVNRKSYYDGGESGKQCLDGDAPSVSGGLQTGGTSGSGAAIVQYTCGGNAEYSQHFQPEQTGSEYRLKARHSGAYIGVGANNALIQVSSAASAETWFFNPVAYHYKTPPVDVLGGTHEYIKNYHGASCASGFEVRKAPGASVRFAPANVGGGVRYYAHVVNVGQVPLHWTDGFAYVEYHMKADGSEVVKAKYDPWLLAAWEYHPAQLRLYCDPN